MALQMVSEEPPRERSRARVSPFDRKLMLATMAETPESFPRPQRGESYTRIVSDRKLMLAMMAETPVSFPEFFTSRGAQKMDFATYNWHELTVHPSDPHVIQRQHPIVAAKPVQSVDQSSVLERFFPGKTKPYVQPLDELERESKYFYQMLGRPELAGRNLPFTIPEGMKVSGLRETGVGLEVTFEPVNKPFSQIIRDLPITLGLTREQAVRSPSGLVRYMMTGKEFEIPKEIWSGFTADIESTPYSLAGLSGSPSVPRRGATVTGGAVSSIVESILAGKPVMSEELRLAIKSPAYAFGSIFGAVLSGYVIGSIFGKLAGKTVVPKASDWLSKRYVESGPLEWKGWKESLVMRVTGAKPYLASEIVSFPGKIVTSIPEVSADIWGLADTPRASVLFTTKVLSPQVKFVPKFYAWGDMLIPAAEKLFEPAYKAMPSDWLMSAPRQFGVTVQRQAEATMPYLPSVGFSRGSSAVMRALTFGVGLTKLGFEPRLDRRTVTLPTLDTEIGVMTPSVQMHRLLSFEKETSRSRTKAVPILSLWFGAGEFAIEIPSERSVARVKAAQTQRLLSVQKMRLKFDVDVPSMKTPDVDALRLPPPSTSSRRSGSKRRKKRGGTDFALGWFEAEYSFPYPEEIMKRFRGG